MWSTMNMCILITRPRKAASSESASSVHGRIVQTLRLFAEQSMLSAAGRWWSPFPKLLARP